MRIVGQGVRIKAESSAPAKYFFSDSDTLGFSYKVGKRGGGRLEATDIVFSDDLFDIY